ncbi:GNAT family N-acetyltransferase [Candidatus Woesearchaeota archaeon]|nr:GNAT family N-acetyltransferase [Candidatus Woesearchaeota archaeon]
MDKLRDSHIEEFFSRFLANKNGKVLIAIDEDKKEIIGYIAFSIKQRPRFYKIKRVGYIHGLMVHKDYRRKGIGKQLMDNALKFFIKHDVKYLYLETSVDNINAINFYKELGLEPLRIEFIGKCK